MNPKKEIVQLSQALRIMPVQVTNMITAHRYMSETDHLPARSRLRKGLKIPMTAVRSITMQKMRALQPQPSSAGMLFSNSSTHSGRWLDMAGILQLFYL